MNENNESQEKHKITSDKNIYEVELKYKGLKSKKLNPKKIIIYNNTLDSSILDSKVDDN